VKTGNIFNRKTEIQLVPIQIQN